MKLPGWKKLSAVVYERNGRRVHVSGICRMPNGEIIKAEYPESVEFDRCVRICGSRRRGALLWGQSAEAMK